METVQQLETWHRELRIKALQKALEKRGYTVFRTPTAAAAKDVVLGLVREADQTIGLPGSYTIRELGLPEELKKRGKHVIDHWNRTFVSPEERVKVLRAENAADVLMTSVNAITEDGVMTWVSGTANNVAGILFGPSRVIIIAGVNKIVPDQEAAIQRIRTIAAPMNAHRLGLSVPCATTGTCMDCLPVHSICKATVILTARPALSDMTVILVDEALGL